MKPSYVIIALLLALPSSSQANRGKAAKKQARQAAASGQSTRINRWNKRPKLSHKRAPLRIKSLVFAGTPSGGVLTFGANKGTSVSIQEPSKNVKLKGKASRSDVSSAQRWKGLTSYTIEAQRSSDEFKAPAIPVGARVKLEYKDSSNRRVQRVETATQMGGKSESQAAWANPNNIWVTHPTEAPRTSDFLVRAKAFEKQANAFKSSLGKKPTREQKNDLHYLQITAKEAKREFLRLLRVEKTISMLQGRLKSNPANASELRTRIEALSKQLPSGQTELNSDN